MNNLQYWACGWVMWLNRLPRYGRTYRLIPDPDHPNDRLPTMGPAEWTYMRHGYWGIYLLQRFNVMWKYLDEYERRNPGAITGSTRD